MHKLVPAFVAALVLASCVSQPAPTPAPTPSSVAPVNEEKDRAKALVQGGSSSSQTAAASTQQTSQPATSSASGDVPPPLPGVLTPEEEAFLNNYLNRLQYMVYYDEAAGIDAKMAKVAVSQANRYLLEKMGRNVVDFDQIEKNKKDQQLAYQSETGGSISIIQYLAQKYNADVYVEISFSTSNSSSGGKFYSSAQGSMKLFDTSTAQLLGSVAFQSAQAMSNVSMESAVTNAIASSVWTAMPKMSDQSQALIKGTLSRGIRYEIVIQKTPDSRAISTLRRNLAKSVREVEQASYSPEETKLYLYTFKSSDKIEDAIYDAAERAGMMDIQLVFSRGKAFTFNSGM